jgi:hypothetical protein
MLSPIGGVRHVNVEVVFALPGGASEVFSFMSIVCREADFTGMAPGTIWIVDFSAARARFVMGRGTEDPAMSDQELQRCREEVQELSEENDALRRANETFGGLAERLNHQLHHERRIRRDDRREAPRPSPDRRR